MVKDINEAWRYRMAQLGGWGLYAGLLLAWTYLNDRLNTIVGIQTMVVLVVGIATSHLLRHLVIRHDWLKRPVGHVLPRLVLTATLLAALALAAQAALQLLVLPQYGPLLDQPAVEVFGMALNWTVLLLIWSMVYFLYHHFVGHRREEVRNLRLETANRENQLGNLRAQLNPHFMFNALNGIRALIDEDPEQAKRAITQLSAILRNAMSTVRRRVVPLGEEIDIVKAYLALEAMRYEERLDVHFELDQGLERTPVPPMLLQTLVENAVRHGIAKLPQGGKVVIRANRCDTGLCMAVENSGHYEPGRINGSGIGLRNTRKRLELIYGDGAGLRISNRDGMVVTEVTIPEHRNS